MLDDHEVAELLAHYPVLHEIAATWQTRLRQGVTVATSDVDEILFDIGTACRVFPLLLQGMVRVTLPASAGREILLYRLEPGDSCILTTSCLLGDVGYQARGVVEEPLRVIWLDKVLFVGLVSYCEPFRHFVFRFLGQRMTALMLLIEEVAFRRLDQRLAAHLLDIGPHIEITHQMLADDLGSVREVISRLLHEFKERGAVRLERGRITVLDQSVLKQIAAV